MLLTGPSQEPASGEEARQLVVLLHGWGADGDDLIDLADPLSRVLPHAAFVAPNGPEACDLAPFGRQWFSLRQMDPARLLQGVDQAAVLLDGFLAEERRTRGLSVDQIALFGFSQGAMLALHHALTYQAESLSGEGHPAQDRCVAAVLAYSGRLLSRTEDAPTERLMAPPVLLVHGLEDEVVPVGYLQEAETRLTRLGCQVSAHQIEGLGHGIDPRGIKLAQDFLTDHL
ncbi:alpha/beta hydrolase [Rhodovibrionaceae bacterium A322]